MMDKSKLAIATISWARGADEEQLLRESLAYLAVFDIPVFITDGGSGPYFINFLQSFRHFTVLKSEGRGVWAQARKSVQAAQAAGAHFILYTEPDKRDFFRDYLLRFITAISTDKSTGIVLASRSEKGFATFPAFQKTTETTINQCCAEIIGKPVDYTYGPFLLNCSLVPFFNFLPEDIGWGWRPFAFGLAHRLQYSVTPVTEDFSCPVEQRADSPTERIYRMRQLSQNIQGLVLSTTVALAQV